MEDDVCFLSSIATSRASVRKVGIRLCHIALSLAVFSGLVLNELERTLSTYY